MPSTQRAGLLTARPVLLIAFAFSVMADPVSSVAYAVEAALRALDGDLALLLPTMALVVAIIALVIVNYQQLIKRYPRGGGAAAASGEAFGDAWAFLPIGALVVDFVLTISISVSAGASALIAYLPQLAGARLPLALGLTLLVGAITWFGHFGRLFFALLAMAFIGVTAAVLIFGLGAEPGSSTTTITSSAGHSAPVAIVLAFPVAMALATGVEAPSSAIAQLGQLDDAGRKLFGRVTLWLTLGIVGTITLALAAEAHHLQVGIPREDSTQIAELARVAAPHGLFVAFQLVTALLLLSAASSSFQAGPGLLKALSRRPDADSGILPAPLGVTNRHHTPYRGVVVFTVASLVVVTAAGGRDQELVLFYAVSVFISFLAGLLAMSRFARRDGNIRMLVLNVVGTVVVAFTLIVNLGRGLPIISLAASLLIAGGLYRMWVAAGRPQGVGSAVGQSEENQVT